MTTYSNTSSDEDTVPVIVSHVVSDEGTIVIFEGEISTPTGDRTVRFAADHREAAVVAAFLADEDADPIIADVPSWAIVGGAV